MFSSEIEGAIRESLATSLADGECQDDALFLAIGAGLRCARDHGFFPQHSKAVDAYVLLLESRVKELLLVRKKE